MKRVRKAVIPAAGLGTRFLPATKAQPKEMLPLIDRPIIQYIVEEIVSSGIKDILIITSHGKRAIEDHFDRCLELEYYLEKRAKWDWLEEIRRIATMANIYYVRQQEPLGLGHAVLCAQNFVGEDPFAVVLGDDVVVSDPPCLAQMLELYEEVQAPVVAVERVALSEVSKYGIIDGEEIRSRVFAVRDLVEKPQPDRAPSRWGVAGRYILTPRIFGILRETPPGAGGEIQLTDALRVLAKEDKLFAYAFTGRRYDAGDKLGYLKATVELALEREDLGPAFREYLRSVVEKL
ncbi:UTP-glucose-1-phosphate uridylyltransferase [Ammonifex degensii KC4]|uniref:UTP--glucose-1-phosphate uridylyltransferase n=1 Tax=Ammonifex degensii (strain DSM 10501 / KC4) TaxID=429009 RepID=C9R9S0_AMMDK|nr:UTP--glucose-1-phosphate uridylyltransferase GalU [Ammonifex degensii]ACX53049.1 UTP-glucose-1-phosphate uridylyltransferase [Ammonifex degensii KC4]